MVSNSMLKVKALKKLSYELLRYFNRNGNIFSFQNPSNWFLLLIGNWFTKHAFYLFALVFVLILIKHPENISKRNKQKKSSKRKKRIFFRRHNAIATKTSKCKTYQITLQYSTHKLFPHSFLVNIYTYSKCCPASHLLVWFDFFSLVLRFPFANFIYEWKKKR